VTIQPCLEVSVSRNPREGDDVSDVLQACHEHDKALEAEAESWTAVVLLDCAPWLKYLLCPISVKITAQQRNAAHDATAGHCTVQSHNKFFGVV
jgi:hypothetical protein